MSYTGQPTTSPTLNEGTDRVATVTHANFDVRIGSAEAGYQVQVFDTPGGDGQARFVSPFEPGELEDLIAQLSAGAAHAPAAGAALSAPAANEIARTIGKRLFAALFDGAVGTCLRRALDKTAARGERLRIRLRLNDLPELSELPWEYLYDDERGQFLCLSDRVSLVRYPSGADPIESLAVEPPLRLLVMASQPLDAPNLDVEAEVRSLRLSLRDLIGARRISLELCAASLEALVPRLRQFQPHLFHFVGHGGFDQSRGSLLLEAADGLGVSVSAQEIGSLLTATDTLRLVLLNACESGRTGSSDTFAAATQQLVRMGIPAVIGMQSPVSDPAAIAFTRQFYEALSDGYPVDAALTEGRKMMFASSKAAEWGTPVMYLRASDTQLFAIEPETESARQLREAAVLDAQARDAAATERWADAVAAVESLLRLDATNENALGRLRDYRRHHQLAVLNDEGLQHVRAERWREALDCFNRITDLAHGDVRYRGAYAHIATAQKKLGLEAARPTEAPIVRSSEDSLQRACATIARRLSEGRVVVVLGGDVNLCGRPPRERWQPGQAQYLPTATEVAEYLAKDIDYPSTAPADGLVSVSQYYATVEGLGALHEAVHDLFDVDYAPTALHRFLAGLAADLRAGNPDVRCPIFVTTNYDDALERALADAGEVFDVLAYAPDEEERKAHFVHHGPDGGVHHIEKANEYTALSLDTHPLVLKVHGAINRQDPDADRYVLAEDDYIDYPSGSDIANLLPPALVTRLRRSHLLFLGYSPHDWSLRVFFRRMWRDQRVNQFATWAVASARTHYDGRFWSRRGADVLGVELEQFIAELAAQLDALPKPAHP